MKKNPHADPRCRTCHGTGEAWAEDCLGFRVTAVCDCIRGYARKVIAEKLLREAARERSES